MENVTLEIAENELESQAARRRELERERRVLIDRIQKAESARKSVKEPIYLKVRAEYEARRRALEKELEPIVEALEKSRAFLRDKIGEIDLQDEEIRDRLDELAFRRRVGEFDDGKFEDARAPLEEHRERLLGRRRELSDMYCRFGFDEAATPAAEPGRDEGPPADMTAGEAAAASSGIAPVEVRDDPESTNRVPSKEETSPSETDEGPSGAEAFVDPTEWLGEFARDESQPDEPSPHESLRAEASREESLREESPQERSPANEGADTLEEFAEPSDEAADPTHGDPHSRSTGPKADAGAYDGENPFRYAPAAPLPVLTITNGPDAGKKLPLLPVTMTLGREVDNNIELKDKDVARYHARISYESGKYVIQDLEGSSGTFVNGERVTTSDLAAGDVIRVGSTELSLNIR